MNRAILGLAVFIALAGAAFAQVPPSVFAGSVPGIPITASSGNVAAATATATLAAGGPSRLTYICGFAITSTGATGAAVVSPTVTGVTGGTMTYTYATVAGAAVANQTLVVPFSPCLQANAANTAIAVSLPSLGAGNTNATVNAWGFQR